MRYRLLDTVQAYAREVLQNNTDIEPRLRRRHFDFYHRIGKDLVAQFRGVTSLIKQR